MSDAPIAVPVLGHRWSLGMIALAALPLVLLAAFMALVFTTGSGFRPSTVPPVEVLTVQQVTLPRPGEMEVRVMNGGPSPVTIAQVAIDDAYWAFEADPGPLVPRLGSTTLRIPYPWVYSEPHEVMLVTESGLTFRGAVDVSLAQPKRDLPTALKFLLLGFYVGVVPVGLGMLWFPVVKRMGATSLSFVLSFTVGLLAFLLIDTLLEGLEAAERLPAGLHGVPLVLLGALLTMAAIEAISPSSSTARTPLRLAFLIALGIGLHNFGEGLAIGAAYTLGEVALGTFLVIGFTLHNVTEGLAVATPLVKGAPRPIHFVLLVLLAGAPAMLGTWVGVFAYSDLATAIFFAIGAGAIAQVVYAVTRYTVRLSAHAAQPAVSATSLVGFAAGVGVMYLTSLLVTA